MATKKVYELTQEGLDQFKIELADLKDVKRPANLEALKEAREQGDLSENADYDAARNEQARIESRISELENIINNSKLIDGTNLPGANIGKSVKLEIKVKKGPVEVVEYILVSTLEADPSAQPIPKISIESPLGKALIGKEENKEFEFKSGPNKQEKTIKILKIS